MADSFGPQFTLTNSSDSLQLNVGVQTSVLYRNQEPGVNTVTYSDDTIEVTAAEDIGLYRAVTAKGLYCNHNLADLSAYAGISTVAVTAGNQVQLVRTGKISDSSWTLVVDHPIFLTDNGVLTQTATTLPIRRIGWAISATEINLDPYPIIGE